MNLNFLNSGIASLCWPLKNKNQLLKHLKCKVPFLLLIILPFFANSQNLVPNPSFEEYSSCPWSSTELHSSCNDWYSFAETPDYFNACSAFMAGVPTNAWGYQDAKHGVAYASLITYTHSFTDGREYIACQLQQPLVAGLEYYVSFYASLYDGGEIDQLKCATNHIGAKFFTDPNYGPEMEERYNPENIADIDYNEFLVDDENWVHIEGWYLATGNHNWLAIGNFFTDQNTDTIQLGDPNKCYGMYYIDQVCIALNPEDCELHTTVGESLMSNISVFPNPASNFINVQNRNELIESIRVINSTGQEVHHEFYSYNSINLDVKNWDKGLYILIVNAENGSSKPFKVLIK
jgi:hypothetical protein